MDEHRRISKLEVQVGELQTEVKDLKEDVKILTGLMKQTDERIDSLVWALDQKGVKPNGKKMSEEWLGRWIEMFNGIARRDFSYHISMLLKDMLKEAGVEVENEQLL